ncbi:hypothetical protein [Thiothrix fructosivorans]|uniref:Uncharacterized protein n=1 Tax=Thiothrix fructosivorans TaxID=111770 RepID=A0A8B0SU33_9GAMM|nr:hypothetical protein [Thiothrix fructosivorans]MBO0612068.1 hypothetical protein [Thiothrix fructosivorans]QTX12432.1 hypothetical protein J1836_008950 [Thiothrix fructosivorans]
MDINVYPIREISDDKIKQMIRGNKSFVLDNIDRTSFSDATSTVEKLIESEGLKCRVYTKGRAAAMGAAAIPISPTVIGGWAAGLFIAAHNIATWDPDYEVAKNIATGSLTITYKK